MATAKTKRRSDRDLLSSAPAPANSILNPCIKGDFPVSERVADASLSLPMHPYLEAGGQDYIIDSIIQSLDC